MLPGWQPFEDPNTLKEEKRGTTKACCGRMLPCQGGELTYFGLGTVCVERSKGGGKGDLPNFQLYF
jgi:hypothetical protein